MDYFIFPLKGNERERKEARGGRWWACGGGSRLSWVDFGVTLKKFYTLYFCYHCFFRVENGARFLCE